MPTFVKVVRTPKGFVFKRTFPPEILNKRCLELQAIYKLYMKLHTVGLNHAIDFYTNNIDNNTRVRYNDIIYVINLILNKRNINNES